MSVRVRFAPSPTGRLHIGNARTAVLNWLFARKHGGLFILRLDDTDTERSTEVFAQGIQEDLAWLGLHHDRLFRQSERFASYDAAADRLREMGRLYPCYETPEELERKRKRQLARGLPPVYDRAALKLTPEERQRLEEEGRRPHWRFLLEDRRVEWNDLIRGHQAFDFSSLSDPVLVRADGTYLYTLPSVVDDIDEGITHVIRGEDHVTNTAVQIQIFEALSGAAPDFAHHSLLLGEDGQGLSKRTGSLSLQSMREAGLEPMAIVDLVASLGTSDDVAAHVHVEELLAEFDLAKQSRAPVRFAEKDLRLLSARIVHQLPLEMVRDRLAALGIDAGDRLEAFWLAVRGNLATVAEAADWWKIVTGPIAPVTDDAEFLAIARALLPDGPWTGDTWREWTNAVKERTGRKGKALFMPLRLALTGLDHGPELAALLPLIGREQVLARLSAA